MNRQHAIRRVANKDVHVGPFNPEPVRSSSFTRWTNWVSNPGDVPAFVLQLSRSSTAVHVIGNSIPAHIRDRKRPSCGKPSWYWERLIQDHPEVHTSNVQHTNILGDTGKGKRRGFVARKRAADSGCAHHQGEVREVARQRRLQHRQLEQTAFNTVQGRYVH